ncbi:MAG: deoxyribose-phosphate aldolase [Aggregatilineaceae bacterium]
MAQPTISPAQLARLIDHTLLRPEATREQIVTLCQEARLHRFASVCVNPAYVALAVELLAGVEDVWVCTVIGFPLGATLSSVKACEAEQVIALGAREVDMVQNVGALKSGDLALVRQDIAAVVEVAHGQGALCKVILETALLTDEEKIAACTIAKEAGADFVKTSTGFGPGGATVHDVTLMRQVVGPQMGVKASGGIRSYADALAMIQAGASRIGASAGVRILAEAQGIAAQQQLGEGY